MFYIDWYGLAPFCLTPSNFCLLLFAFCLPFAFSPPFASCVLRLLNSMRAQINEQSNDADSGLTRIFKLKLFCTDANHLYGSGFRWPLFCRRFPCWLNPSSRELRIREGLPT
ncbi:MAG: hypothetical protein EA364_04585 [Balneolaceae bacterium]|nr:MAG: hypothetical protein EA364_04585 [Balneolaceae bacterium]